VIRTKLPKTIAAIARLDTHPRGLLYGRSLSSFTQHASDVRFPVSPDLRTAIEMRSSDVSMFGCAIY